MRTAPPSSQPDLSTMLGEVRAAIAAEGPRQGLAGKVQEACVKILEVLMELLMDFRAGTLAAGTLAAAAADAGAACVEGAACAASGAPGEPAGSSPDPVCRGWWPAAWFRRHDWLPAIAGMRREVEGSSARRSGDDGANAGGATEMPRQEEDARTPVLSRFAGLCGEADRRANGAGDAGNGFLPEVGGTKEPHELRASPRPQRCRSVARRTQTKLVVWARWGNARDIRRAARRWVTPRVGEAYPPYRPDGGALRWSFFKKCGLAREDWRGHIVPA